MNSGLLGALGSQPLKTQRFYNRPYGSSMVLPNTISNFNISTYRTSNLTNWSSNGTMLGINAAPNFGGDLFNAQVNSSDRFRIDSGGSIYMAETSPTLWRRSDVDLLHLNGPESGGTVAAGGAGLRFGAGSSALWTHDIPAQTPNTGFVWEGFGALGMRVGTQTQSLRIYNTFTSTTNYERFTIDWQTKPNTCVIATSAAGTGVVRDMEFRVGSTTAMSFTTAGNTVIYGNLTINGNQPGYSPARPSFRVYGSGTTNNLSTTQNSTGVLNNNNFAVDHNQGSHLNASNGIFTAPVAGIYQINLIARNSGFTGGISQIACVKNEPTSNQVMTFIEWAASSSMNHTGASTCAYLSASDTLCIKILAGQINFDGNDSWSVTYLG